MPKFIKGIKLSELFYKNAVKPILESDFKGMKYSAALIGYSSEVLGYDTPLSRDHNWGPRLLIFLSEAGYKKHRDHLNEVLKYKLPHEFLGYPTNFVNHDAKSGILKKTDKGPINHRVEIRTIKSFFKERLNVNPYTKLSAYDWLTFSEQRLLTVTKGKVYHDDLGLDKIRETFEYYPKEMWLYILAAQWTKISQEEAFLGRTGDVGDELGSRIVSARLVRELMRLCFLMEKKYAPYTKWFGTGFSELKCAKQLKPVFVMVLSSNSWKERESNMACAYGIVANMHNKLKITKPLKTKVSKYHNREYLVIHADAFAQAILKAVKEAQKLTPNIGSINQFIDSTDVNDNIKLLDKLKILFYD